MTTEGIWLGHLYLRPPGAPPAQARDVVEVAVQSEHDLDRGLLALRLLAPLAALPASQRTGLKVRLAGSHVELAKIACEALDCDRVVMEQNSADQTTGEFHRVLFGCDEELPSVDQLRPLIASLREDGQLGIFNLPAARIVEMQKSLASTGFAVRAAGTDGAFGFLAGRVESPAQFRD